jgi:hypothetical protein
MLDLGGLGIQLHGVPKKIKTDQPGLQANSISVGPKQTDHGALVSLEDDLDDLYDDDCEGEVGEEGEGTFLPLSPSNRPEILTSEGKSENQSESDTQQVLPQKNGATATIVPSAGEVAVCVQGDSTQFHPLEGVFVWNFPDELLFYLGLRLGWEKSSFCCEVSKKWCAVLRSDALWSTFRSQFDNPSFTSVSARNIQVHPFGFAMKGIEHR